MIVIELLLFAKFSSKKRFLINWIDPFELEKLVFVIDPNSKMQNPFIGNILIEYNQMQKVGVL